MFVINFWQIFRCLPKVCHFWRRSCKHNWVSGKLLAKYKRFTRSSLLLAKIGKQVLKFSGKLISLPKICGKFAASLPQTIHFGKGQYLYGVFLHIFDIHVSILLIFTFGFKYLSIMMNFFFYLYPHPSHMCIQYIWNSTTFVIHVIWALFVNYLFLYMI